MTWISNFLVLVVAAEALFIMVLELFLTQTKLARQAFALSKISGSKRGASQHGKSGPL